MKRLLVALVVIASLCWITFYLYDVNSTKNNFTPEAIFNVDDGQILIVNRPAEIDVAKINGFDKCPSIEVIKKLDGRFYNRAYFSAKRPHMLISGEENWTVEQVKNLFGNDGRVKFDNSTNAFTYLNYSGMIHKRGVYLRDGELQKSQYEKEFNFDKKSSASLISFENENSTVVTDIYYKTLGRFDFITRNAQIKQGKQVNDRELFASYISDQITSYSFHERDYYRTLDSTFTKGPLSNWMDKGFVEIEINGKTALISDYLPGQDPLLILNDLEQEQSNHYKTPLTSKFGLTKNYYVKYLEDMVVLSEDESTCDLIIGDMKLGRTISLNGEKRSLIFGNLPQNVSQRTYRNGDSYSQTVYKGYLLTAKVEKGKASTVSEKNKPLTMAVGDDVIDFKVLNGVGNVVVLTKSNFLVCFNEGKKIWTKKLESLQNKIEVIDLYASGDEYILVSGDDHINLFDIEGKSSSGFPISLESETTAEAKFYRWKNRSYIIVPTVGNKVSLYDGKGGEIRVFNSKIKISQKIDVWASQRRLFYGFKNGEEFVMHDVAKKRTHRQFKTNGNTFSAKIPNELLQFQIKNNRLVRIDQKATRTNLSTYSNGEILFMDEKNANPTMIINDANQINLINHKGVSISKFKIPFNEIESISLIYSNQNKTIVGILDGLENNVYLYGLDGARLTDKKLEGQSKVELSTHENENIITTIVDRYLVQYFEN